MPMTRRDSITIPADDPIVVAVGGDNDIVIAQADKIGEEDVIYFDVRHANAVAAAILTLARQMGER